ncbi:hypothetical protein C8R43DRAFT_967193 [Mycena crocata]|nr:hypothetical protein C8R43DRAFT_967193 [Mycena crocata]
MGERLRALVLVRRILCFLSATRLYLVVAVLHPPPSRDLWMLDPYAPYLYSPPHSSPRSHIAILYTHSYHICIVPYFPSPHLPSFSLQPPFFLLSSSFLMFRSRPGLTSSRKHLPHHRTPILVPLHSFPCPSSSVSSSPSRIISSPSCIILSSSRADLVGNCTIPTHPRTVPYRTVPYHTVPDTGYPIGHGTPSNTH